MRGRYELPPLLMGTAEQQLRQLRDYLVRLVEAMADREEDRDA